MNIDVEIGIFHVEIHEPGFVGEGDGINRLACHHTEHGFLNKGVELSEVQNGAARDE